MKTLATLIRLLAKPLLLLALVLGAGFQQPRIPCGDVGKSLGAAIDTLYIKNLLLGKVDYSADSNFVRANPQYTHRELFVEKNTYAAFVQMHEAAKADGVDLKILSAARSFEYQKRIWEQKWALGGRHQTDQQKAIDILRYSAMPGTSRHHWGTDIDINSLNSAYFESGRGLKEYTWLTQNAMRFGFCQAYTSKCESERSGYEMEKWHWSYLPIAIMNTRYYARLISYTDLVGFSGSKVAQELMVIDSYVFGVSECEAKPLFQ
ncbi:MAG: M15 family metallopeptidase [Bacteroidales bacterium]|nr:M15 family metallopeptidase [Bacteroidales bacterium]